MAVRPLQPVPPEDPYGVVMGLINEVLDNGDFVPADEARMIDNRMRAEFPSLHLEFLEQQSYNLYFRTLRNALGSRRSSARYHRDAGRFGRAVAAGDKKALGVFQDWRIKVDDADTQRAVGDMVGADHIYAATSYEASSERHAMLAAFHRAVAKKVGRRKTKEVFSEAQFMKLYDSIVQG